jgi:hypothetical protein
VADFGSSISKEYKRWWRLLRPEEKRALIESGAFRADDPMSADLSRERVNDGHFDFQQNEEKSFNQEEGREGSFIGGKQRSTLDEVIDREELSAYADPRLQQLELASIRLRSTLHFLLEALDSSTDNEMRLHADIIRIVVGEGKPPQMTVLAKRHRITKSAVSLRCRKLLRRLGLDPSRFMRSQDGCNTMFIASLLRAKRKPTPPIKESFNKVSKNASWSRPRRNHAILPKKSNPKQKRKS